MDITETDGQIGVDAMDVDQFQHGGQVQYAWPGNAQNIVSPRQLWTGVVQVQANARTDVYSYTKYETSLFGSCSYLND